jgi:hypothetical protein
MTFRGMLFEAKKPEKRKPNDIFCRSEVARRDRFRLKFLLKRRISSPPPSLRAP